MLNAMRCNSVRRARLTIANLLLQALGRRKHNLGGSEEASVGLLLQTNKDDVFIYD